MTLLISIWTTYLLPPLSERPRIWMLKIHSRRIQQLIGQYSYYRFARISSQKTEFPINILFSTLKLLKRFNSVALYIKFWIRNFVIQDLNMGLTDHFLSQIFHFIDAQLFNVLIDNVYLYSCTYGFQLKMALSQVIQLIAIPFSILNRLKTILPLWIKSFPYLLAIGSSITRRRQPICLLWTRISFWTRTSFKEHSRI